MFKGRETVLMESITTIMQTNMMVNGTMIKEWAVEN